MLEIILEVNNLRAITALIMLGIATILDIKNREINDLLWIIFGVISVVILFFETDIFEKLISIGIAMIIAPIVLILWRFGLFGGADAFALIVLAALAPSITWSEQIVTPLTTLTNAAMFSIIPLIVNAFRNLVILYSGKKIFEGFDEPSSKKILALFLGYKAKTPKHAFSIEKKVGRTKKFSFAMHHAENAQFCTTRETWVTPGIPYLVYITAGFVFQLFFGDVIFNFNSSF